MALKELRKYIFNSVGFLFLLYFCLGWMLADPLCSMFISVLITIRCVVIVLLLCSRTQTDIIVVDGNIGLGFYTGIFIVGSSVVV